MIRSSQELENGNFRYDEEFYRDLDEALARLRRERTGAD